MIFTNTAVGTIGNGPTVYFKVANATGNNTVEFPGSVRRATMNHSMTGGATVQVEYDVWPHTIQGTGCDGTAGWVVRAANDNRWVQVAWDRGTSATNCVTLAEHEQEWAWQGTNATTCRHTMKVLYRVGEGWIDCPGVVYPFAAKTPEERLKEILQARQAPMVIGTRKSLQMSPDEREQRARDTLRRVLGEAKFRNFIKCGFVSVKAKSGRMYQIFPGHGITCVYEGEKLVERLCVVLTGNFPPTDSLIMRYIMILNNEQQFRGFAVKHGVEGYQRRQTAQERDQRPLSEIFKELKGGVVLGRPAARPVKVEKVA
jgi:hypothetical protein